MRAVTQNRRMAAAMGISTARIDMLAFGLGSGVAGIAGRRAVADRQRLAQSRPGLHHRQLHGRRVRRGRQSVGHRASARLMIGVANKLLEPLIGAVQGQIVLLIVIILFIQKRPARHLRAQGPRGGSMSAATRPDRPRLHRPPGGGRDPRPGPVAGDAGRARRSTSRPIWCSFSASTSAMRSSPSRSISSGAIAASCRSATAPSSPSAATRWACI